MMPWEEFLILQKTNSTGDRHVNEARFPCTALPFTTDFHFYLEFTIESFALFPVHPFIAVAHNAKNERNDLRRVVFQS